MRASIVFLAVLFVTFACVEAVGPLWKVFCQQTPIYRGRADPIVEPGMLSQHSHKVFGSSGFGYGYSGFNNDNYQKLFWQIYNSTCTTASITIDKSNYWIPDLYYQWPNGSFSLVEAGGLTVYYPARSGNGAQSNPDWQAFPRGFRMTAGSPFRRNFTGSVADKAINYACLAAGPTPQTPGFPTQNNFCKNGLRAQVWFPQCWNGKDLDSPDHQSHVSYPDSNPDLGNCPPNFPIRLPGVFYEVLFSVDKYPHGDGKRQPFVWSCGDPTGYGLHGDFLSGWDPTIMHAALHDVTCYDNSTNAGNTVENCKTLAPYVKKSNPEFSCLPDYILPNYEDLGDGHAVNHLPGCNPISTGTGMVKPCFGSWPVTISNPGTKRVLILASNGKYLRAMTNSGEDPMRAVTEKSQLTYRNTFIFTPVGGGRYSFFSEHTNHFVGSYHGGKAMPADKREPSDWEFFSFTNSNIIGQTSISAPLAGNMYVQLMPDGTIWANATSANANTVFTLIDANAGVPDTRTDKFPTSNSGEHVQQIKISL